jgi:hypothetical protein
MVNRYFPEIGKCVFTSGNKLRVVKYAKETVPQPVNAYWFFSYL